MQHVMHWHYANYEFAIARRMLQRQEQARNHRARSQLQKQALGCFELVLFQEAVDLQPPKLLEPMQEFLTKAFAGNCPTDAATLG